MCIRDRYYSNLLAGYDLLAEKEKILERQYDNHIAILEACKEGDCNNICQEVKKDVYKRQAVQFTPVGGMVNIRVSEKPCRREGYTTVIFSVKDNGIGMSPEFR